MGVGGQDRGPDKIQRVVSRRVRLIPGGVGGAGSGGGHSAVDGPAGQTGGHGDDAGAESEELQDSATAHRPRNGGLVGRLSYVCLHVETSLPGI